MTEDFDIVLVMSRDGLLHKLAC